METITIPNTNITITVTNAEEMFVIFNRLHPWMDLEVHGTVVPQSSTTVFTRSAFYQFFNERRIEKYTVKIDNTTTLETLEGSFNTFEEARKAANLAYFAAGYNTIKISVYGPDGEIEEW